MNFIPQLPKIGLDRIFLSTTKINSFKDIDENEKFDDSLIDDQFKESQININSSNLNKYKNEAIPCIFDEKIFDDRIKFYNYQSLLSALSFDETAFDNFIEKDKGKWVKNIKEVISQEDLSQNNINEFQGKGENFKNTKQEIFLNQNFEVEFESRFESGNLRMALQISELEYDLIVKNDINAGKSSNWFFFSFEIKNKKNLKFSESPVQIKFNIINCQKTDTLFSKGLKVLYFSQNNQKWQRSTKKNYYFHNSIVIDDKKLYTLTFSLDLNYDFESEKIFFCYCYPYTFSKLQNFLGSIMNNSSILQRNIIRHEIIGKSLAGNNLDMLIITKFESRFEEIAYRPCIVLTSRVHPGETNASWVIQGVIEFLLEKNNPNAEILRKNFIFKIVPMLNPDGVINGNFRTSLIGKDLNRLWDDPREIICPTIFHTKEMIKKTLLSRDIFIYCDFHGHSNKPNFFLYGCPSNKKIKINSSLNFREMVLSKIFTGKNDIFDNKSCIYKIAQKKLKTARAVVKNEFNIDLSYCLESSIGHISIGERKNEFFTPKIYEKIGRDFCISLFELQDKTVYNDMLVKIQNEETNKTTFLNNLNNLNNKESNNNSSSVNTVQNVVSINHNVNSGISNVSLSENNSGKNPSKGSNHEKNYSGNNKIKDKFNRHFEREKINNKKNSEKDKEKEKENQQKDEKPKEKEIQSSAITRQKNDNKTSFTIRNINIINSISNIDASLTDTYSRMRNTKKKLNPIKTKRAILNGINSHSDNINNYQNNKNPNLNKNNSNSNSNHNENFNNPNSFSKKGNYKSSVITLNNHENVSSSSSSNLNMFNKMANKGSNSNSSINNNEEITQRIRNAPLKKFEKKERKVKSPSSLSSKKLDEINNDNKLSENLFTTIRNLRSNLNDVPTLRNKSINDLKNKKNDFYNNFGILPNIRNKLHNSSPSNFNSQKSLNENSRILKNIQNKFGDDV